LNQDPFTHRIIGHAMATHRALGPGLGEEFYHRDLALRLESNRIEHRSKPRQQLLHRGHIADIFEPDLVFTGRLVVELKSLRGDFAPDHFSQLFAYLKFHANETGLLFDFGKASLVFKRVLFEPAEATFPDFSIPEWAEPLELATAILNLLREIHRDHGLGYRETTYRGLFAAALRAEGLAHMVEPTAAIGRLGPATLRCIVVAQRCAVSITALGEGVSAADRSYLQTCLRWLGLPWGIAIHFGRTAVDLRFVIAPSRKNLTEIQDSADQDPDIRPA